ncbi:Flavin-containing monooxygenase, variant 2 [Balamuthia mandrillaris]
MQAAHKPQTMKAAASCEKKGHGAMCSMKEEKNLVTDYSREKNPLDKRVCVIGGGFAGIYALKSMLEVGFTDVVLYENTSKLGGIWCYGKDRLGSVFRHTCTSSSKIYLHASDFPMPPDAPHFPHHSYIYKYILSYVDHFKLWPHVRLNHCVKTVRKKEGRWWISVLDKEKGEEQLERFDVMMVCTGLVGKPKIPKDEPNFVGFTGEYIHSAYYKHPTEDMEGKNVLIVGGGESASDIAVEVCEVAKQTYMSLRQGVWFHDRTVGAYQPADVVFTKHQRMTGLSDYQSWMIWLGRFLMIEFMWGKGGTGIPQWHPKSMYFHGFVNKSRDVVDRVAVGRVKAMKGVTHCEGKQVWFEDEEEPATIDKIIFCTGFKPDAPFLKPGTYATGLNLYKLVFQPDDPTLCFIGTARPFIGGIPPLAELQARWAAAFYSGKCSLPSLCVMRKTIEEDTERHARVFPCDHATRPFLVNMWEYSDLISSYFGAKPQQLKWLFWRSPLAYVAFGS